MKNHFKQNRLTLFFLLLVLSLPSQSYAHPGHADPVTISRSTHTYMQQLIPHYLIVQKALATGELSEAAKNAASEIQRLTKKARKKETDSSGKKMYKGVAKNAGFINSATNLKTAREAFDELNNIMIPFFDNWPAHISEHNLILYTCEETKQWWLQANTGKAIDPYLGAAVTCENLIEKEG